jgi:hypothetical protein
MTPDEFRDAWNDVATESGEPSLRLPPLTVEDGSVQDVASVVVTDRIALNISVNKADGSVRDVGLITEPSDDFLDNTTMLLAWGALFRASTVPPAGPDHAGAVFDALGLLEGDFSNLDTRAVVAGVEYTAQFPPELGLFFVTAADPSDSG